MHSHTLTDRLYRLKKYLPRGYAAAVCQRMEKKDKKISIHMLYKVAAGKVFHPAALQELIAYAQEQKQTLKTFEKQVQDIVKCER
jgi:hypothetical protein